MYSVPVYYWPDYIDFPTIMEQVHDETVKLYKTNNMVNADVVKLGLQTVEVPGKDSVSIVTSTDTTKAGYQNGIFIIKAGSTVLLDNPGVYTAMGDSVFLQLPEDTDLHGINDTVIAYDGTENISIPMLFTRAGATGEFHAQNPVENPGDGTPLIFAYPNVTGRVEWHSAGGDNGLSLSAGEEFGHVVAPYADIIVGGREHGSGAGNYNGSMVGKNFYGNSEGHVWPYNGTKLIVSIQCGISAKKELRNGTLAADQFTFNLWQVDDSKTNIKSGNVTVPIGCVASDGSVKHDGNCTSVSPDVEKINPLRTARNKANGGVQFADIENLSTGTYYYMIREQKGDRNDIAYDESIYFVVITASQNEGENKVTTSITYTDSNGTSITEPKFVNAVKTTKFKLGKVMNDQSTPNQQFKFEVMLYLPAGTALNNNSEVSYPMKTVASSGGTSTNVTFTKNNDQTCVGMASCVVVKNKDAIELQAGQTVEFSNLPENAHFSVKEIEFPSDYELDGYKLNNNPCGTKEASCTGAATDSANESSTAVVIATNKRKAQPVSLTIMKRVVDKKDDEIKEGLPADAAFEIRIDLYQKDSSKRVEGNFDYKKTGDGQKEESGKLSCNANGCDSIILKPWQTITITGLPDGTQFNVAETDAGGFEHVSTVVSKPATCASKFAAAQTACQLNDGAQGVVTVTNRYVTVVLPETGGKAHPFMTMLFGVGVVCAGLLITAIYMRRQGMAMLQ